MIARHREWKRRFDAALAADKAETTAYRKALRTCRPDLVAEAQAAQQRARKAWDAYYECKNGGHGK